MLSVKIMKNPTSWYKSFWWSIKKFTFILPIINEHLFSKNSPKNFIFWKNTRNLPVYSTPMTFIWKIVKIKKSSWKNI